jgi:hypothetical protein
MAGKGKIIFYDTDEKCNCGEYPVPDTLRAQKLFNGDIKLTSKKGGSDGEAALTKFLYEMSTWQMDNMAQFVPSGTNEAYLKILRENDGVTATLYE